MKTLLRTLIQFSWLSIAAGAQVPTASNVFGKNVTYQGLYESGIEGFIGIRFAEDTGGQNRFRPPVPYTPAAGSTIQALNPGPSCPQRKSRHPLSVWSTYDFVSEISEDCLRLNVWRPNGTTAGDKLPVLVWIYGGIKCCTLVDVQSCAILIGVKGSFIDGNKDGILMQPGAMQAEAIANGHPIMNVEINYRLNCEISEPILKTLLM